MLREDLESLLGIHSAEILIMGIFAPFAIIQSLNLISN